MALINDRDSLIWGVIDIQTAEYREAVETERIWDMLTSHQCSSVIGSARIHHTTTRYHIGCAAIAAYAWLREHEALESAWMQTKKDAGNEVARGVAIQRIRSFQHQVRVEVRTPREVLHECRKNRPCPGVLDISNVPVIPNWR